MDWETLPTGEPWLRRAPWALRCRLEHRVPVGSSILLTAVVLDIRVHDEVGDPLVYHDRAFHSLGQHSILP